MARIHPSPAVHHGPKSLWDLFVNPSPDLPRAVQIGIRVPIALAGVGLVAMGAAKGLNALNKAVTADYHCTTVEVGDHPNAIATVQEAGTRLGLPDEPGVRVGLVRAAQHAQSETPLQPTDYIRACATHSAITGWNITAEQLPR